MNRNNIWIPLASPKTTSSISAVRANRRGCVNYRIRNLWNTSDLSEKSWLDISQHMPNTFVSHCAVIGVMYAGVTERMEGNHGVDIIRPIIGTPVYMMTFEVWLTTTIVERRRPVAALTDPPSSSQYMSRDRSGTVINVPLTTSTFALVSSIDCLLTKLVVRSCPESIYPFIEFFLPKRLPPDQIENYLLHVQVVTKDIYLVVTIVKPLTVETIFSMLLDKEQKRPASLHMIGDLRIIVVPGVAVFCPLAVILVTAVRQEPIVVPVVIPQRVGHDDHSVFSIITVTDPHNAVPAKRGSDVSAAVKYLPNMLMPRHALPPVYLPEAVSLSIGCRRVKEIH